MKTLPAPSAAREGDACLRQDPADQGSAGPQYQLFSGVRDGCVHWRLLGRDNWDLGHSCASFSTAAQAREEIARLRLRLISSRVTLAPIQGHRCMWTLTAGGDCMVVSARPFDRRVRRQVVIERFITPGRVSPQRARLLAVPSLLASPTPVRRCRSVHGCSSPLDRCGVSGALAGFEAASDCAAKVTRGGR